MRTLALVLLCVSALPAADSRTEYVQAVEFPYYLYPRAQWERELVWLKTIGVSTVEFSVPWNWHQLQPGDFDFTGRTSPRRDLAGLVRILRRLELRGWVRPLPPVAGWANSGWPADAEPQSAWLKQLENVFATQTEKHGGPIAFVEGGPLGIDALTPPTPVTTVSATDPNALARSRAAIASSRGALLWTDVEDAIYPAGWATGTAPPLRKGAVALNGEERPATGPLRREAALLRNWAPLIGKLRPAAIPKPPTGKMPRGVTATELISKPASAVSVTNRSGEAFRSDLRVLDPATKRALIIPAVSVPAGETLWLPLNVSLGGDGLCRECSNFSAAEHIVYATEELLTVEFENGILAMEFAAPEAGEVILQLAREPIGPLLAAGRPTKFDWDENTLRARLPIPAGKGAGNRVRIGLAIEAPETSAFFSEARRLIIGQKNLVSTVYSSPDVASRSRLRAPEGFAAAPTPKSPNEIDYSIAVPPDALHGDFAAMALEADGVPLGRARVQLFRPASIRMSQAIGIHFGPETRLLADPPTGIADLRAGGNIEIVIRNNSQQIQNYHVQPVGEGLDFLPAQVDISIGAVDERPVSFRVFAKEGVSGLCDWRLRVTGGAEMDLPMRTVLLPRSGTVAWRADLDGDGSPEWILESAKVRAVFSTADGGRWIDFTWKDTDTNFLPEAGEFLQSGPVEVHAGADGLEFIAKDWTRTVHLADASLAIEQKPALPHDTLTSQTTGNLTLSVDRESPSRAVYTIRQASR